MNYPVRGQKPYQPSASDEGFDAAVRPLVRVNTEPLPTTSVSAQNAAKAKPATLSPQPAATDAKKKPLPVVIAVAPSGPPENKDSSEYKKKKALEKGPLLELDQGNYPAYGMEESLFTALKDLFESIIAHSSKTGIVKPSRFLEILRSGNDMFNGQQHQDAHEFLNYVLNEVIENVEAHQKRLMRNGHAIPPKPTEPASSASSTSNASGSVTGWMHEIFQGQLTSETKCLTCENVSRRDEHFLDLSIDLEKNSSVTSCLRAFSASEMLCERNKFHCDTCGGLQEAEKRMKIKRLPKVLALHLKRFKYMEETGRFEKLHHHVLYPYHLRLFNTTDDAEDPDRLYELYAVVVHIGGGPYHGHYVAIIKTEDKGWLLFDDELVEPVDKSYVRNFFGERTGTGVASAYLLFYQETTEEAVQREQWADEAAAAADAAAANVPPAAGPLAAKLNGHINGNNHLIVDNTVPIDHAVTSPLPQPTHSIDASRTPAVATAEHPAVKSKKDLKKEARSATDPAAEPRASMSRFRNTSRSLRQPPKWLGGGGKTATDAKEKPHPPLPGLPIPGNDDPPKSPLPGTLRKMETLPLDWKENSPSSPVFAPVQRLPSPPPVKVKDKDRKKEKERGDKEKQKRGLHHHRPSLFSLRKKAQTAFGAGE